MRSLLRALKTSLARTRQGKVRSYRHQYPGFPAPAEREAIYQWLSTLRIDDGTSEELRGYLEADLDRFLYTLLLVPQDRAGRALEIGANPYFMSVLLRELRAGLKFDYLNYFEGAGDSVIQSIKWSSPDGTAREDRVPSYNVNLEAAELPVEASTYDLILFCEVLEHFTMHPLRALNEIWRGLKPDGVLILTTPNVARFENVAALIEGRNLYDPYSGYGPHGRHNREYTRHELHTLMRHAGFECEVDFTSDVHGNIPGHTESGLIDAALGATRGRENDLGQYLFSRWKKTGRSEVRLPAWLYRSYPSEQLCLS